MTPLFKRRSRVTFLHPGKKLIDYVKMFASFLWSDGQQSKISVPNLPQSISGVVCNLHFFNLLVGIPECASLPLPGTRQREQGSDLEGGRMSASTPIGSNMLLSKVDTCPSTTFWPGAQPVKISILLPIWVEAGISAPVRSERWEREAHSRNPSSRLKKRTFCVINLCLVC